MFIAQSQRWYISKIWYLLLLLACIQTVTYTGCPTRYRTRHFFNNFTTNEDIATKFEADLPHCVRNVKEKNVLLFKFRWNIFIGVRIIKEMPGSVASGTSCIIMFYVSIYHIFSHYLINDTIFNKEIFKHKITFLIFSTNVFFGKFSFSYKNLWQSCLTYMFNYL